MPRLLTELLTMAYRLNRSELFLSLSRKIGLLFFWRGVLAPLREQVRAGGVNGEQHGERLARFCRQLALYRATGKTFGAIVANANPFIGPPLSELGKRLRL